MHGPVTKWISSRAGTGNKHRRGMMSELSALYHALIKVFNVWYEGGNLDEVCMSPDATSGAMMFLALCVTLLVITETRRWYSRCASTKVMTIGRFGIPY